MNITSAYQSPPGPQTPAGSYPYPHKPRRPPVPGPLRIAVALMYAGLAGSVINMIIWAVAGSGAIRARAAIADPFAGPAQINDAAGIYAAVAVVIGLVSAGLWVWMALANRYGQSWARIAATALFGVYTLAALGSFVRLTVTLADGSRFDIPAPVAAELTTWIIWLAGLAAVIALWQHQSSAYYRAVKRHAPEGLPGPYPPHAWYATYPPYAGQASGLPPSGAGPGQPAYGSAPPGPPWHGPAPAGPVQSPPQPSPMGPPPQATPPPQE